MEASYYQTLASPQLEEGWLDNLNQQDFCEGAKELNSLHPVSLSSTFHNSSNYDGWMNVSETLGCNEYEPFEDVLLPETKNFGPDYFDDFHKNKLPSENINGANDLRIVDNFFATDNLYLSSQSKSVAPSEKPKITIKLKKVKVPKKNRSRKYAPASDYEIAPSPSEIERLAFSGMETDFHQLSQAGSSLFDDNNTPFKQDFSNEFYSSSEREINDLLSDDYTDLQNFLQEIEEPSTSTVQSSLTLKEAITMENADSILGAYLSPDRSSSSLGSPREQSINLSFQEENLFSPGTSSRYSFSEGLPSPSSSSEETPFEENLATDTQMLFIDDSPILSSPRDDEQPTRRGRKPKQKMTPESRYLRKKEQNKQAALRYRAKKKVEDEQLMETLKEEVDRNSKLKKDGKNLLQEFKFMKKLLKESLIARNLVSPNAFH